MVVRRRAWPGANGRRRGAGPPLGARAPLRRVLREQQASATHRGLAFEAGRSFAARRRCGALISHSRLSALGLPEHRFDGCGDRQRHRRGERGASLGAPQSFPLVAKRARDAGALGAASWHKLTNHTSESIVKRPLCRVAAPRRRRPESTHASKSSASTDSPSLSLTFSEGSIIFRRSARASAALNVLFGT